MIVHWSLSLITVHNIHCYLHNCFLFISLNRTWGKQFVVQRCLPPPPSSLITSDHTRLVVHYFSRFVSIFLVRSLSGLTMTFISSQGERHASALSVVFFPFRGERLNSNKALSPSHRGSLLSEEAQPVEPPGVPFSLQPKAHRAGFASLFGGVHPKLIKKAFQWGGSLLQAIIRLNITLPREQKTPQALEG